MQTIHKNVSFELETAEGREEDAEELTKAFIRPFALNRAPLVRSKLIRAGSASNGQAARG